MIRKVTARVIFLNLLLFNSDVFAYILFFSRAQTRCSFFMVENTRPRKRNPFIRSSVPSQVRPRVIYDPYLGIVTPVEEFRTSKWANFRSKFYNAKDVIDSWVINRQKSKKTRNPIRKGYKELIEQPILIDNYEIASRKGEELTKQSIDSSGQRLIKEFQHQPVQQVNQMEENLFDTFKESIYSISDKFSVQEAYVPPKSNVVSDFKPYVQPTLATSQVVRDALPKLRSRNPFQRFFAKQAILRWERTQIPHEQTIENEHTWDSFKESVSELAENVEEGIERLGEIPPNMIKRIRPIERKTVTAWLTWFPRTVTSIITQVTQLPSDIQTAVIQAKGDVEAVTETVKELRAQAVALPDAVYTQTSATFLQTVQAYEDAITAAKRLTGLEPPPPPPPKEPKPLSELPWDIAKEISKASLYLTFLLAKSLVKLSWIGSKIAWDLAVSQSIENSVTIGEADVVTSSNPVLSPSVETEASLIPVGNLSAIKPASQANTSGEEMKELEEAVRRAKEAAMAATEDALEVEQFLSQRMNRKR